MINEAKINETTFKDYLGVVFGYKAIISITFFTVMITAIIGLLLKTPIYESQVTMLISAEKQIESPYYKDLAGAIRSQIAVTHSEIVRSRPVLELTVKALKLNERPIDYEKKFCNQIKKYFIDYKLKDLKKKLKQLTKSEKETLLVIRAVNNLKKLLKVTPIRDSNLFIIKARDYDPKQATNIANTVSRSYCIFDLQQQLAELRIKFGRKYTSVNQLENNINKLKLNLSGEQLPVLEAIGPASIKIIEQANIPLKPVGRSKYVILIFAFLMSISLGIILAFIFNYFDQTFKSPQDIVKYLHLPFLASIPKKGFRDKVLIKNAKKETRYTRFIRKLTDRIYIQMKAQNLKTLLIISPLSQGGSTSIIVNLGICISYQMHHKTLIVDANLRNPTIHEILKLNKTPGLANLLEKETDLNEIIQNHGSNLDVLSSGDSVKNPVTLLHKARMDYIFSHFKQKYEIIIIDSPSLNDFDDATLLSSHVDGIILVVNQGRERRIVVTNAIQSLLGNGTNIIGVIMNKRRFVIPKIIYNIL